MYEFSVPMPYFTKHVDKLININKKVVKSKITSLYFCLPKSCNLFTGFEQPRFDIKLNNFEYWKKLMIYSINKGFDFIYLLNSPRQFESFINLDLRLEKLNTLLIELKKIGINKLRITNPQLLDYITENYSDFELYASVSLDFKTLKEYINFQSKYNNIKQFVLSGETNKNFKLIKNLKKIYPETDFEIVVNQGCPMGCPYRKFHSQYENLYYQTKCDKLNCSILAEVDCIYPWEIKEYKKIGINKFKLVGREQNQFVRGEYIEYYYLYLNGIENIKNIQNIPIKYFINYMINADEFDYTIKEIKKFLPNIKHFKKYGHLCASRCKAECRYCFKCAEKIQRVFEKKQKELNGL